MTKYADLDIGRLTRAVEKSRLAMKFCRERRVEAVRQYVGNNCLEEGSRMSVPVNMIALYVSVVGRNLIAKNPRVLLETFDQQSKPAVSAMQTWANDMIDKMYFADVEKRVVTDALFSLGITKVALMTPAENVMYGYEGLAGEPRASRIDMDDWVYDIHARDFRECGFMGHRYRVPLEVVKEDKNFNKYRKDLQPTLDRTYNEQGDERISMIGRGYNSANLDEFDDYVDLWEIYVPRRRAVITIAGDDITASYGGTDRVLREQSWIGPDCGPYHTLGYGIVPGNAMAKAPIQDILDLHLAINNVYRKLINQAHRFKELLLYSGDDSAAQRIIDGNDGDGIKVDNPEKAKVVAFGGPAQILQVIGMEFRNICSWIAGNLDIMGGLSPQSKTATQDTMLNQNSSKGVADMQDATTTHVASVLSALSWYWWHDPTLEMKTQYKVPGVPDVARQLRVSPQQRQRADWRDIRLKVDPYSMRHSTPQSRWQDIMNLMESIIRPFAPMMEKQGITVDFNTLLHKGAEYLDSPDLAEIIKYSPPVQMDQQQGGQPEMNTPEGGTKTYERISSPGMTKNGNDQVMAQIMAGGNPQQSQRSKLGAMAGA